MDAKVKMRLQWVQLYRKTDNASVTCRRCGISRPTLRKWTQRYEQQGLEGLQDQSRRPKNCPPPKVLEQHRQWIVTLRKRRLGSRRIQSELIRLHQFSLSTSSIHKVLTQLGQKTSRPLVDHASTSVVIRKTLLVSEYKWMYAKSVLSFISTQLSTTVLASKSSGSTPTKSLRIP